MEQTGISCTCVLATIGTVIWEVGSHVRIGEVVITGRGQVTTNLPVHGGPRISIAVLGMASLYPTVFHVLAIGVTIGRVPGTHMLALDCGVEYNRLPLYVPASCSILLGKLGVLVKAGPCITSFGSLV